MPTKPIYHTLSRIFTYPTHTDQYPDLRTVHIPIFSKTMMIFGPGEGRKGTAAVIQASGVWAGMAMAAGSGKYEWIEIGIPGKVRVGRAFCLCLELGVVDD